MVLVRMDQTFFRRVEVIVLSPEAIQLTEMLLVGVLWVAIARWRRLAVLTLDLVNVRVSLVVLETLLLLLVV